MKKIIGIYIVTTIILFAKEATMDMGVIEVVAPKSDEGFSSSQVLNREDLDKITSKNHSITEALKVNPNVFFKSQEEGTNSGEINMQDISINGAKFYQNNFLIDGINFNNDLNPGGSRGLGNIWVNISSGSQSMNIDTDLLDSIEVLDSSISAKYGGFQGGVVKAKTRNPQKDFHGVSSFSYTSGDWTKVFYAPGEKEKYKTLKGWTDKSDFIKKRYRFGLEGYIRENFGLLVDYTKNESVIKMLTKESAIDPTSNYMNPDITNTVDNYFFKGIWHVNDFISVKPSYLYSKQENTTYFEYIPLSDAYFDFNGHTFGLEMDIDLKNASLSQSLSYKKTEGSRYYYYKGGYYMYRKSNIKNWGTNCNKMGICSSFYGSFADMINGQENINYKADLSINDFDALLLEHKINLGLELDRQKGTFVIASPLDRFSSPAKLPPGHTCDAGDLTCINDDSFDGNGQFFTERWFWGGINNKEIQKKLALYLEDIMSYERFKFRPGLRVEKDTYTKTNFSPRFTAEADMLNDERFFIGFGLNRYYGRNLMASKLYNKYYSNNIKYKRTAPDEEWKKYSGDTDTHIATDLKTPYDDELSLFFRANAKNTLLNLKFTKRKSKNQVLTISRSEADLEMIDNPSLENNYRIYTNLGKTKTDIFTFDIANQNPISFFGTEQFFGFAYAYMDKWSNFSTYRDRYSKSNKVLFEGQKILALELPPTEFYNKHTYKFHHNLNIPALNLTFSNFLNVIGKKNAYNRERIEDPDAPGKLIYSYQRVKVPSHVTLDTRISWHKKIYKGITFFSNLDINNILNKKYVLDVTRSNPTRYATGRNFWLEMGLKW